MHTDRASLHMKKTPSSLTILVFTCPLFLDNVHLDCNHQCTLEDHLLGLSRHLISTLHPQYVWSWITWCSNCSLSPYDQNKCLIIYIYNCLKEKLKQKLHRILCVALTTDVSTASCIIKFIYMKTRSLFLNKDLGATNGSPPQKLSFVMSQLVAGVTDPKLIQRWEKAKSMNLLNLLFHLLTIITRNVTSSYLLTSK